MCCHLVSTASSSSYWCWPQSVLHLRTTRLTSCPLTEACCPMPLLPAAAAASCCLRCKCNTIHIYEYKLVQYIFMIGMQSAYFGLYVCLLPVLGLFVLSRSQRQEATHIQACSRVQPIHPWPIKLPMRLTKNNWQLTANSLIKSQATDQTAYQNKKQNKAKKTQRNAKKRFNIFAICTQSQG